MTTAVNQSWTPTHVITIEGESAPHFREVTYVKLVDGAGYTQDEWEACANADWECNDEGEWSFQGEAAPYANCSVSVSKIPVTPNGPSGKED